MTRTKELKPPAELVEAINQSEDMTAPPSASAASDTTGPNVPRTVRNRLEHEEFAPLTAEQKEVLEDRAAGGDHNNFLGDPEARKAHMREIQSENQKAMQFDRQHMTAGTQGQGTAAVHHKESIASHDRITQRGPHYHNVNRTGQPQKTHGTGSGMPQT